MSSQDKAEYEVHKSSHEVHKSSHESQVNNQLISINENLMRLQDFCDRVDRRLKSVLKESNLKETVENPNPIEQLVPLANDLSNYNFRLYTIIKYLEDMCDRIEV